MFTLGQTEGGSIELDVGFGELLVDELEVPFDLLPVELPLSGSPVVSRLDQEFIGDHLRNICGSVQHHRSPYKGGSGFGTAESRPVDGGYCGLYC
ncbi:hypothetical protein D3C77_644180 [compost metagenome]